MNCTNLIHEYKGKQDLYIRQKPMELKKLVESHDYIPIRVNKMQKHEMAMVR